MNSKHKFIAKCISKARVNMTVFVSHKWNYNANWLL